MTEGRFFSSQRSPTQPLSSAVSTFCVALSFAVSLAISGSTASADVVVDLSAIGQNADEAERIAPGRAPVILRRLGSAPEAHIVLTPPPSVAPSQTQATRTPAPAPSVIAPASSRPVPLPEIVSAPEIVPVVLPPARPTPTLRQPEPVQQAAFPDPSQVRPAPLLPVERVPAPATQVPVQVSTQPPTHADVQETASLPAPSAPIPEAAPATTSVGEPRAAPANIQTASLPPPAPASHRLRFEADVAAIPTETREELELVAAELMRHSNRIEIQAYAGPPTDLSSEARRLSLQRGLAVRKYLVEQGVLQSRIDVRALGGVRDSGPAERVDIVLSSR